jgi:hypothetical protein
VVDRAGAFCFRSLPQAQGRQKITCAAATEFPFAAVFWEQSHERNDYSVMVVHSGPWRFRHLPQTQGKTLDPSTESRAMTVTYVLIWLAGLGLGAFGIYLKRKEDKK